MHSLAKLGRASRRAELLPPRRHQAPAESLLRCRFKVAVSANAAIALLEVASVAIAVLKIFSDLRQPAAADAARLRSEAAFAIVSCCFTIAGFAANVLGLRRLLALLRSATHALRRPTRVAAVTDSGGVGVAVDEQGGVPPVAGACEAVGCHSKALL